MAYEEYYCGCGRRTEDGGLCEACSSRWTREKDRIRDYTDNNNLGYDDQQQIESRSWERMDLGSRTVRYCTYRGSCGNVIEVDWEEYCPSCTERQKQDELDEERRRQSAVDDY